MRNENVPQAKNYIQKHKKMSVWNKLVINMAAIVVFVTTYMLILPAITMETNVVCSMQEHTHSEQCYTTLKVLSCGLDENIVEQSFSDDVLSASAVITETPHVHTDACYTEQQALSCSMSEHVHADSCFKKQLSTGGGGSGSSNLDKFDLETSNYGNLADYVTSVQAVEQPALFETMVNNAETLDGEPILHDLSAALVRSVPDSYSVVGNSTKYDQNADKFTSALRIDFTTTKAEITENGKTFVFEMPDSIVPDDSLQLDSDYYSANNDFIYQFKKDENGKYYIVAVFEDEFVYNLVDDLPSEGYIQFLISMDGSVADEHDNINVKFDDKLYLKIDSADIEYPSNSTASSDLGSEKSGSYDAENDTLSYKVTVYSNKGSGGSINFDDQIVDLHDLTIEKVDVSVKKVTQQVWMYYGSSYGTIVYGTEDAGSVGVDCDIDIETGKISAVLPELSEPELLKVEETGKEVKREAYVIEYTYKLSDLPEGFTSTNISNKVNVASKTKSGIDINAENGVNVRVSIDGTPILTKTSSPDSGMVKWVITVGDGKYKLPNNGELTDIMFSQIVAGDVEISPSNGYKIVEDENGNISSIKFGADCAPQYTVTYYSSADVFGRPYNKATFTDSDGKQTSADSTSYNTNGGNLTKSDAVSINEVNGVHTLQWTATFDVPSGGIPAGTTVEDSIRNDDIGHSMSAAQAKELAAVLSGSDGWKSKVENLLFRKGDWSWVSADQLADGDTVYAFKFNFSDVVMPEDCEGESNFAFTYCTTADTKLANGSCDYTNNISCAGKQSTGSYRHTVNVIKTDGKGKTEPTKTIDDDGYVTWKVIIELDDRTFDEMTVIDNLPEQVDLKKLEVAFGGDYNYTEISKFGTSTLNYLDFTTTVDTSNVAQTSVKVSDNETKPDVFKEGSIIYLRYTCKIKDELVEGEEDFVFDLTNNANVKIDDLEFGTAGQTQTLTVPKAAIEKNHVEKGYVWDSNAQRVHYTVEINPNGDPYGDGDTFGFTDTLSYLDGSDFEDPYEPERDYDIDTSSLKLYYAESGYQVGEDGKSYQVLVKGEEIPIDKWSYTYSTETVPAYHANDVKKILKAQLPNNTPLILEYDYKVKFNHNSSNKETLSITNVAKIDIDSLGYSDEKRTSENWQQSSTSADIDQKMTYTVYKVSQGNFNSKLKGAVFALYQYDKTENKYIDTGRTFTTNEDGYFEIKFLDENLSRDTMYYIQEILPPDGYMLPESPEKLYFYATSTSNEVVENNMPDSIPSGAIDLAEDSPFKYIENVAVGTTQLQVGKQWYNSDGTATGEAGADSINFIVKRKFEAPYEGELAEVSYNIKAQNGYFTGSKDLPVGKKAKIVFTKSELWYPSLVLSDSDGNSILNNPEYNMSNGWSGDTFSYEFEVKNGYSFTGDIGCDLNQFGSIDIVYADSSSVTYATDDNWSANYTVAAGENWGTIIDGLPSGGMVTYKGKQQYANFIYYVDAETTELDGYVSQIVNSEGSSIIKNTKVDKKSINVIKKWLDENGDYVDKTSGSVKFRLVRKALTKSPVMDLNYSIQSSWGEDVSGMESIPVGAEFKFIVTRKNYNMDWVPDTYIYVNNGGNTEEFNNGNIEWSLSDDSSSFVYVSPAFTAVEGMNITGKVSDGPTGFTFGIIYDEGSASDSSAESVELKELGTYVISSDDGWHKSVDVTGLPSSGTITKDGKLIDVDFIYCIEELNGTGYNVTYENAEFNIDNVSADEPFESTIINKTADDYHPSLPETGGSGTLPYTLGGMILLLMAGCLYITSLKVEGGKDIL